MITGVRSLSPQLPRNHKNGRPRGSRNGGDVHGEFKCPYCDGKKFEWLSDFTTHMRRSHRKRMREKGWFIK